jgi:hypothetical protein
MWLLEAMYLTGKKQVSIVHCDVTRAHSRLGIKKTVARSQPIWLTSTFEIEAVYSY